MKIKELRIGNFVTIENPVSWLKMSGVPVVITGFRDAHVSFDHDLADVHYHETMHQGELQYEEYLRLSCKEKTGYECALFMKQFYNEKVLKLPIIFVHSMNPVGVERIKKVFSL